MRKFFLTVLLLASTFTFAQTKYMIYFKDKDAKASSTLSKTSAAYQIAERELAPQAIERRKQVMGEDSYITYEDLPLSQNYLDRIQSLGIKIENKLKWFNAVSSYLTDEQLNSIKKLPFIEKVERVRVLKSPDNEKVIETNSKTAKSVSSVQSSLGLNYGQSLAQNALSDIPEIHNLGIKGTNVYVGILDDGFSWKSYAALKNLNVVKEYDYVEKDNDAQIQSGHGAAVFSIMAGYDPGKIIGPAFDAKFFLAKTEVDATETHVEEDNYAAALQDMEAAGVDITSSSLGYNIFDTGQTSYTYLDMNGNTAIVTKAVNLANQRGVSTFTAAGNDGNNSWHYIGAPADAFDVITVGAVDPFNVITGFSSRGPTSDGRIKPEIVAMGSSVYHVSGNGYASGSGTSFATPIAAGIAALLKSAWPHLTNKQIRKIFLECGDNATTPNVDRGWGLISAKRAVAFPNLSKESSIYKVNKIFIDANGVNSSTVNINYKSSSGNFQTAAMNFDGTLKYNYILPNLTSGSQVELYFTYQNTSGGNVREPVSGTYKFSYGDLLINSLTTVNFEEPIPTDFVLYQNYPNPFNPSTIIKYSIPFVETQHAASQLVTLKVYDILGREVATLVNEEKPSGNYEIRFNAETLHATSLPSGVYIYRIVAGNFISARKMLLIK